LYWETQLRADAGALTQALGTRDGDFLRPTIQRFIIEEEGLLLLCSDGLSDNDWVEQSWENYGPDVIEGKMSLEAAVQSWIRLANEKNGYDNTSVVATHCRMSPERLVLFDPAVASAPVSAPVSAASVSLPPSLVASLQKSGRIPESQLSESSKQLLYPETSPAPEPVQKRRSKLPLPLLGVLGLILAGGGLGLWMQSLQSPQPDPAQLPPPPETPAPSPSESPSPGAESPSPSPESTPAEIPPPDSESLSPSPESTPAEIPPPEEAETPLPSPE